MTELWNIFCSINQMDRMTYGRIPKHIQHYKATEQTPDHRRLKQILHCETAVYNCRRQKKEADCAVYSSTPKWNNTHWKELNANYTTNFYFLYRCTVHFDIYTVHTPTNTLFIKLDKVSKFTLKITLTCSCVFRSTTMRWCGSMLPHHRVTYNDVVFTES